MTDSAGATAAGVAPAATSENGASEGTTGERRPLSLVRMSLLALVVGVVTGLGAVLFRDLIGLIHNLLFLGRAGVSLRRQRVHRRRARGARWSSWCRWSARSA